MAYSVSCKRCGWEELIDGSWPSLSDCPQCSTDALSVVNELGERFRTDERSSPALSELAKEQIDCIGRDAELHSLTRWLLVERRKRVVICGSGGIGKTILAQRFEETYRVATGGTFLVLPPGPNQIGELANAHPGVRDLLMIDEPAGGADALLDWLADNRPDQAAVVISGEQPSSPAVEAILELKGLPNPAIARLLRRAGLTEAESTRAADKIGNELSGHPMIVSTVGHLLGRNIPIDQIVGDLQPFEHLVVRADVAGSTSSLVEAVVDQSERLFDLVRRRPALVHTLTGREFEELVAEMFTHDGFDVTLTPIARDGGKDIYAAKKDRFGSFLYVVECKRYAPERPVGVSLVRSLHGVVQAESATAGIMVTTSRFTKPAQAFQEQIQHQLSLLDYHDLARWLRKSTAI